MVTESGVSNAVPVGGVIMWSGAIVSIPDGWVICDGTHSTPDLRDRFVVGAGSAYAVAAAGGATTHNHGSCVVDGAGGASAGTISTVNHLPPYYALAYIMKT